MCSPHPQIDCFDFLYLVSCILSGLHLWLLVLKRNIQLLKPISVNVYLVSSYDQRDKNTKKEDIIALISNLCVVRFYSWLDLWSPALKKDMQLLNHALGLYLLIFSLFLFYVQKVKTLGRKILLVQSTLFRTLVFN